MRTNGKRKILLLAISMSLALATMANADVFVRGAGTWTPEQEFTITPPGPGGDINFDSNDTFGAQAEVGVYSPMKLLSFGVKGSFENLRGFNPVVGVESVDAQVYSLMGNMCANVQNKSALTPYACGAVGVFWIDPNLTLPGGFQVGLDKVSQSGYGVEAGLRYAASKDFSVYGGVNWRDTFDNFIIGVDGIPGTGAEVDIGRFGVVAGIEF